MAYNNFVFENNDDIVTIRLNDPEKLNALISLMCGRPEMRAHGINSSRLRFDPDYSGRKMYAYG